MKRDKVTAERLREVLDYDASTGLFRWLPGNSRHLKALAGKIAGSQTTPYVVICIDGTYIGAHRLAWLFVHGSYPEGHIDHINGDCRDNRISNLRDVTQHQNMLNRKISKRNSSGAAGVDFHGKSGKWRARITFHREQHYTLHSTKEEAVIAVKALREKFHGEFARVESIDAQEARP